MEDMPRWNIHGWVRNALPVVKYLIILQTSNFGGKLCGIMGTQRADVGLKTVKVCLEHATSRARLIFLQPMQSFKNWHLK